MKVGPQNLQDKYQKPGWRKLTKPKAILPGPKKEDIY
jgi:hypothetical protein